MLSIVEGLLLFVAVNESVLGVLGNGFIGLVNCINCVKNKKISTLSLILTGLASSRHKKTGRETDTERETKLHGETQTLTHAN